MTPAGSTAYGYDANGNMTSRGGSSITVTSYNLPSLINQGSNASALSYGAFRNRFKQVTTGTDPTTTIYVAGILERVTRPGGVTEFRHQIHGPTGPIAIYTRRSSGTADTYYLHRDHLGSPELVTNAAGTQIVKLSFGAFGERRGTNWTGTPSSGDWTAIGNTTRDGFTDHEHLDNVGLVHMNGRVYDPKIGRFLSPDPFIDCGLGSQGVNRYGYVGNNPLRRIDPSGFTAFEMEEVYVRATRITGGGGSVWTLFGEFWGVSGGFLAQQGSHDHFSTDQDAGDAEADGAGKEPAADQGDAARQQCLADCENRWEGGMQTAAGAAGGAAAAAVLALRSGNPAAIAPAMAVGAVVGGVTGAASGFMTQAVRASGGSGVVASGIAATFAAPVGYTATAFSMGGRATFGAAMFGATSGALGGLVPGSGGAAASAAAGAMAGQGRLGFATFVGAGSAALVYQLIGVARDVHCASECSAY